MVPALRRFSPSPAIIGRAVPIFIFLRGNAISRLGSSTPSRRFGLLRWDVDLSSEGQQFISRPIA
ncbi:MAG: hypothetical protein P8N58_01235 [Emcibacteraceae bacterium]|nr:hypothetical protein [Emcibacteraceae bacterium]